MALKTLVKIGNVNNLSDARYCAGMGVEFLGFNLLENTSNYIDESQFKAITGWVAGIKTVGEFGTADSGYILNMAGQYAVDYIQTSRIDLVGELSKQTWPIILEIEYNPNLILENLPAIFDLSYSKCHYILLSNHGPHQMQPIPEKVIQLINTKKTILDGWFDAGNVTHLIDKYGVSGISLSGGQEIKPGLKDFDELSEILEKLEVEEPN